MNTKCFFSFISSPESYVFNNIAQDSYRKGAYLGGSENLTKLVMQLNYFVNILPTFPFHCTEVKKIETHNQYNKEQNIIRTNECHIKVFALD